MIHVVAGVLRDASDRILIAQRRAGSHMGGHWEFPGGKLESGEQPRAALARELHEELGITVVAAHPLICYSHNNDRRKIFLDVWTVSAYTGEPTGREGQSLRWVAADRLHDAGILEADRPILDLLTTGH